MKKKGLTSTETKYTNLLISDRSSKALGGFSPFIYLRNLSIA